MYPDCRDTGIEPQIDYTSLLSFPTLEPLLGSQPVTCVPSIGGKTLSFKDLLGQPVTLTIDDRGMVKDVRWQKSADL